MFKSLAFQSAAVFRRHSLASGAVMLGATGGAGFLLFLHLMQTSPAFAEAVANNISTTLAEKFACGCPLCARACTAPNEAYTLNPAEQGLARFSDL